MTQNTQITGAEVLYQQDVKGDTISGPVTWEVDLPGPTLSNQVDTTTYSRTKFICTQEGSYVLTARVPVSSGQKLVGQIRIDVIAKSV